MEQYLGIIVNGDLSMSW